MDNQLVISPSKLLTYCIDLMARDSNALGFVPRGRFAERIEHGQVLPAWDNGQLAGYILIGRPRDWLHIHQTAIQQDARRLQHGQALVDRAMAVARGAGCQGIGLRCAVDLPSNAFWMSLGFSLVSTIRGNNKTGRMINVYQLAFPDAFPLLEQSNPAT